MKHGANSAAERDELFTGTCHPSPIEVPQSHRSSATHEGFPGWRDSVKLVTPSLLYTSPRSTSHILSSMASTSFSPSSSHPLILKSNSPPNPEPTLVLPTCQTTGDRGMELAPLRYQPLTWSFQTDFS